jgi:O-antigen ligase
MDTNEEDITTMQETAPLDSVKRTDDQFFFLKLRPMWEFFRTQHFSFWMICIYLFFEYTRPQSIYPAIDILPWTRLFLIGSLIGAFADNTCGFVKSRASILLIFFAIAIFLSSLFAVYPEESREHFIDFYGWFVIYFLITSIVNTRNRYYVFLVVFLLCSLKIALGTSIIWAERGFSFTDWGLQGPKGYFCNSGELSILMLTLLPLGFFLLSYNKKKLHIIEKILRICCFLCPFLTILGASSRGSQIAMVAILAIIFRKKIFNFKFLIAIVVIGFLIVKLLPEEQKLRFTDMGNDDTSIQRKLYWKHGREMIREHPVLGVGFFNFPRYYQDHYYYDMVLNISGKEAELPHNIFIQVGTDAGFTGLIPFSLILLYCLITPFVYNRRFGKDKNDLIVLSMIGTGYGIFGFIIAGQFVTVSYYPFLWIGLSFIVAAKNILQKEQFALAVIQEESKEINEEEASEVGNELILEAKA